MPIQIEDKFKVVHGVDQRGRVELGCQTYSERRIVRKDKIRASDHLCLFV